MKQRTKLCVALLTLMSLGVIGLVLAKIQRDAAQPFPGARVVLDDASWKKRELASMNDSGYLWAAPDTLVYQLQVSNGSRVILRHILPNGTAAPPQTLPLFLTEGQNIHNLSPDGRTLCVWGFAEMKRWKYTFLRTDGQSKPVGIESDAPQLFWSPDSNCLYAMTLGDSTPVVERFDPQKRTVQKISLDSKGLSSLDCMTPEGKLLGFRYFVHFRMVDLALEWEITEVQGRHCITTTYSKLPAPDGARLYLAPNGRRLLWEIPVEENTWVEQWQRRLLKKTIAPHHFTRWQITDIDGKNERDIGITVDNEKPEGELNPEWTPDSKGVHFIYKTKLWYLPMPE